MKKYIRSLTGIFFMFFMVQGIGFSEGTSNDGKVVIGDLAAPNSPAFVLLGVEPSSIDRPTTPKKFVFSTMNLFSSAGASQPQAIEVSPYWLIDHPSLSYEEYTHPEFWQSIIQSTSLSLATSSVSGTPSLGVGLKCSVLNGEDNPQVKPLVDEITKNQDLILDSSDPKEKTAAKAAIKDLVKKLKDLDDKHRVGIISQLAGGLSLESPQDLFTTGSPIGKWGIWSTSSYRISTGEVEVMALVRYLGDSTDCTQNALDLGMKFLFQFTDLGLSTEYLGRWLNNTTTSSKLDGQIDYRIDKDAFVTLNFGRDFNQQGRLLLGLKFNGSAATNN